MPKSLTRRSLVQGATIGTMAASLGAPLSAQDASPVASPAPGPITIYQARKIVTLHDIQPDATHVAMQDGWVLGAGSLEELSGWGEYVLDDSLKDLVIVPGFIEGHSHVFEAYAAFLTYVGYYDRPAIDGTTLHGVTSYDELVARLQEEDAALEDPGAPIVAFG